MTFRLIGGVCGTDAAAGYDDDTLDKKMYDLINMPEIFRSLRAYRPCIDWNK